MDAAEFRDAVADAKRTELERLGSNKLLVAVTGADLSTERVLRAAADSENAAHNTFAAWAADEPNGDARETFAAVADQEAEHRERVLERLGGSYDPVDGGPMHEYLRSRSATVQRVAAGLVARSLVIDGTHKQLVSFFINEADERRADLFRELRAETEDTLERGLLLLDSLCANEGDWADAQAAAEYVIQVAYDDYADALQEMGVDPKPIC